MWSFWVMMVLSLICLISGLIMIVNEGLREPQKPNLDWHFYNEILIGLVAIGFVLMLSAVLL